MQEMQEQKIEGTKVAVVDILDVLSEMRDYAKAIDMLCDKIYDMEYPEEKDEMNALHIARRATIEKMKNRLAEALKHYEAMQMQQ